MADYTPLSLNTDWSMGCAGSYTPPNGMALEDWVLCAAATTTSQLYLAATQLTGVYLGSTPVSLYAGGTLVFGA